jgi:hypothetical protein
LHGIAGKIDTQKSSFLGVWPQISQFPFPNVVNVFWTSSDVCKLE